MGGAKESESLRFMMLGIAFRHEDAYRDLRMAAKNDETSPLLIRCPACGQRFKVGAELRDRTVECGACERRFRLNDDVILRSRKFYPGEHPDASVNRYQRVPMAAAIPEGFQTVSYADNPDTSSFEPRSPQRLVAGASGVLGVVLMALLLYFGAARNGTLDGVSIASRMLMAGFTSVTATALFLYANPRARMKTLLFSLLCSAGLLALPLVSTEDAPPKLAVADNAVVKAGSAAQDSERAEISRLRQLIGTDPLEAESAKLATESGDKHAYGLWLRGLSESNKLLVRDYLLRVTKANSSHPYPREHSDYLMVVSGLNMTLDKLAELAAPLGEISHVYRDIEVIEVRVHNGNFVPIPLDKLTDRDDPAFYELNKRELDSIDLERVQGAVKRLAEAAPKLYRNDITRRLIALLKDDAVEFKDVLCRTLMRWSDEPAEAADAAEVVLKKILLVKKPVPRDLIGLLVKAKRISIIPMLDALWLEDTGTWEPYYMELGPAIEATLIRHFTEVTGGTRHSIVHMLVKVGGRDSLPLLKAARVGADAELLIRIEAAEKAIHERLGE